MIDNYGNDEAEIAEWLLGSSITSVTFGSFHIVVEGLGSRTSGDQVRWQLRSSSRVGFSDTIIISYPINYVDAKVACSHIVSCIDKNISDVRVSSAGVSISFGSDDGLLFERDEVVGEAGDLEVYSVARDMTETLEGSWSL